MDVSTLRKPEMFPEPRQLSPSVLGCQPEKRSSRWRFVFVLMLCAFQGE
jgi:hypothetical protein